MSQPSCPATVCDNQDKFNDAFKQAVQNYGKVPEKDKNLYMVLGAVYLVLTIWALVLAMRISDPEHRVLHVGFALILGPAYILCYYLAMLKA